MNGPNGDTRGRAAYEKFQAILPDTPSLSWDELCDKWPDEAFAWCEAAWAAIEEEGDDRDPGYGEDV